MKNNIRIIRGVTKTCLIVSVGIGFSQMVFASESLDALQKNAEFHYKLEGEERIFDGLKQIDQVEALSRVQTLQEGTIVIRARYEGQASSNYMYTLLGMGNAQGNPTQQIAIGAALNPLATRYELGGGLYSSAWPTTRITNQA